MESVVHSRFVRLYAVLFALLPWTLERSFGDWSIDLPAEPVLMLAGGGLLWALISQRLSLRWPRSLTGLTLGLWVGWLTVSALGSGMPVVSWKYWLVTVAHVGVFFFGLQALADQVLPLVRIMTWSLSGLVLYALLRLAMLDFRGDMALLSPQPFFPENTSYAAVLVLFLPLVFLPGAIPAGRLWEKWGLAFVLALGIVFSGSRAAQLVLGVLSLTALIMGVIGDWRGWLPLVLLGGVVLSLPPVHSRMYQYIREDVSLQERFNRYDCAFRMGMDKPVAGFGPGVFQFAYFDYQQPERMTRISSTEPVHGHRVENNGRGGGAHSEYLQALAETGWPGFLFWLMLVAGALVRAVPDKTRNSGLGVFRTRLVLFLAILAFALLGLSNNHFHDVRFAGIWWLVFYLLERDHS